MHLFSSLFGILLLMFCADQLIAKIGDPSTHSQSSERAKTLPERVCEEGDIVIGGIGCSIFGPAFPDLASLISGSKIIVLGRIANTNCRLTVDQMGIWTDLDVEVFAVLHNMTLRPLPKVLSVYIGGGTLKFPCGTVVNENGNYPISSHPRKRQRYILFLETSLQEPTRYAPVDSPQGVFGISRDLVIPAAAADHPLFMKYFRVDLGKFLAEVTDMIAKRSGKSSKQR